MSDDDIKAMFREVAERFKEVAADFKETDLKFKETSAGITRLSLESEQRSKEAEQRSKEAEQRNKEAEQRSKQIDKQIAEHGKQIGGLGEKFGSFTEGLAYPSMCRVLYERFHIDNTCANYLRRLPNGEELEYDAFGYTNGVHNNAVVAEVKSHLTDKAIRAFALKLKDFRRLMPPEFHDKRLYGIICVAGKVSASQRAFIEASGLFLARTGDNVFRLYDNPAAIDFSRA